MENKTVIMDLKKQIQTICEDVNSVKGKVAQVKQFYHEEKKRTVVLETRMLSFASSPALNLGNNLTEAFIHFSHFRVGIFIDWTTSSSVMKGVNSEPQA